MFEGRNLLIATKHKKEKVIAPILEKELGVKCFITDKFDTDQLGTFTGEVERKNDPITTARNKCLMAMQLTNCDMAIASEGSFGPHPSIFYIHADDEFLLFIDLKNNLEIIVREVSTETNFNGAKIKSVKEMRDFAKSVNFPTHGLIAKKDKDDFTKIIKGIADWNTLLEVFSNYIKLYGEFYLETDMRAMFNPTRMLVIEKATLKLAKKINTFCPKCNTPGFGVIDAKKGLPCELCKFPTRSTLSHIYSCKKCFYTIEEKHPYKKQTEDPMYCDMCNP
jgi:hypothetical protein